MKLVSSKDKPVSVDWKKVLEKYSGVGAVLIPEDIRKDVLGLVGYARAQYQENLRLHEELQGARETLLALCIQANGPVDVPFSVVEQIQPDDVLRAEDLEVPAPDGGTMKVKRFRVGSRRVVTDVSQLN